MRLRYCAYPGTCQSICSDNVVYNFLMQLLPLKSLVFVMHFLNEFWHGKDTFPKSSSYNETVPLLIDFHLPYSKYKCVKICFYLCHYQNQNFSLVSHSCHSYSTRFALVLLVQHSCRTFVGLVLLVSHSCCTRVASVALVLLVSNSCCLHLALVLLIRLDRHNDDT